MADLEELQATTLDTSANGERMAEEIAPEITDTEDEGALRSLIFQKQDIKERVLYVPEWGVQILVRALNGNERAEFIEAITKSNMDMKKLYPDLVTATARHVKTKKLVFKPADRGEIMKKAGSAVERIAMASAELSGLTEAALNDMRKN